MSTPNESAILQLEETAVLRGRDGREFSVRRLGTRDRVPLQAFGANLGEESRKLFLPHAYDDATVDHLLKRSQEGQDLTLGLFDSDSSGETDPPIIGYFFLWYFDERVSLLGIGLLDAYQGMGLGGPMIGLLLAQARIRGCEGVELTTLPGNRRAYALYEKYGFKHYDDVPNVDGSGRVFREHAMFHEILAGAKPLDKPHAPPILRQP